MKVTLTPDEVKAILEQHVQDMIEEPSLAVLVVSGPEEWVFEVSEALEY